MKPFSESCEQNRQPIIDVIGPILKPPVRKVLELGSGTGQHAVYFSDELAHLHWQTSDLPEAHAGIHVWLDEAKQTNLGYPLELNLTDGTWPSVSEVDAIFSANVLHIVGASEAEALIRLSGATLGKGGHLLVYGPFNYNGQFSSESNARFEQWLKSRDPRSGIKDFDWLNQIAEASGLHLQKDYEMPVNNRILHWHKR